MALTVLSCRTGTVDWDLPSSEGDPAAFHSANACQHLETLTRIRGAEARGGRRSADDSSAYVSHQLRQIGAEVREVVVSVEPPPVSSDAPETLPPSDPAEWVSVVGTLQGRSDDVFLLVAPLPTIRPRPGAPQDSTDLAAHPAGAALLLELARTLSSREARPYTIVLAFVAGDSAASPDADASAFPGSYALASAFERDGLLSRVRVATFFDRVSGPDLEIARDLRSHQVYRELFWVAAESTGHSAAFDGDARLESPPGSHWGFLQRGLPRVVMITDPRPGKVAFSNRVGAADGPLPPSCDHQSLAAVGEVSLDALDRIGARLTRIDRFPDSPPEDPEGSDASSPEGSGQAPEEDPEPGGGLDSPA